MIWGLGTGCSGTESLARLLDGRHEPFGEGQFTSNEDLVRGHIDINDGKGATVSWIYSFVMPEIRKLDTDAYFVAVFRDPIDTIRCFVNKGIFRRAGPDTLFLAHENMPGWPPLNHWVRCMSNILVSMKDTDDWEVWWIDEIPGKKLNKSKKRRDLVDFEIDDINNWSGRVLPRMHEAHAESLQRGRPILEGIPND